MASYLRNTMSDIVNSVYTCNALLLEEVNGLAFLLRENSDQHISASHFTLSR